MSFNHNVHNSFSVGRFRETDNAENLRPVTFPGVLQNIYCITKDGKVYSNVTDCYISWSVRGNLPYVNLSTAHLRGGFSMEPYFIKDLVACSFLENSRDYLERGYHVANIDGDPMNCRVDNLVYLK